MAYRLVPVRRPAEGNTIGHVNTGILYDRLMNTFRYGNMEKPDVYMDETNRRMVTNLRNNFGRLAEQLTVEGKNKEAIAVCDRCLEIIPDQSVRFDYYLLPVAATYLKAGADNKGIALLDRLLELNTQDLNYYFRFPKERIGQFDFEMQQSLAVVNRIGMIADQYSHTALADKSKAELEKQYKRYMQVTGKR